MKITITAGELIDKGVWDEFCNLFGISVWAVNEGRMSSDEEFTLTLEQARKIGLRVKSDE